MNGTPAAEAADFEVLLPRIAHTMRRPELIIRASGDDVGADGGDGADARNIHYAAFPRHEAHAGDVTFALETELSSVKVARAVAAALLRSWHVRDRVDDVTTVISELVTNALRHGTPIVAREWVILFRLIKHLDTVMCVVADASTLPPVVREPNYVAETGRGMHVVQSYSRRWGWMPCPGGQGKIVWAVFW
jgi:hypothetical protein